MQRKKKKELGGIKMDNKIIEVDNKEEKLDDDIINDIFGEEDEDQEPEEDEDW